MAELPGLQRTEFMQTRDIVNMPASGTAAAWEGVAKATAQLSDVFDKEAATAEAGYVARVETEAMRKAVELREKYNHNPEGFDEAWLGYKAGVMGNVPGHVQDTIAMAIDEKGASVKSTLMSERRSRDRTLATDSINTQYESIQNEMLALARNGDLGEKYLNLQTKASSILQSAVNLELRSQDSANIALDDLADRAKAESILGNSERLYETGGYDVALKSLEGLRDPELNLSPEARDSIFNRGHALVTARYNKDKAAIAQVNAEKQALLDLDIGTAANQEDIVKLDQLYADTEKASFLSPAERTDRLLKIQSAQKTIAGDAGNTALVYANLGGASLLDPTDASHRKAANSVFNREIVPAMAANTTADPEQITLDFISKTNIVPDTVKNKIVGGLAAGSPEHQIMMAGQLTQILDNAPFAAASFNEDTIGRARHISTLSQGGMSDPEEIIRQVQESAKITPEIKRIRGEEVKEQKHFTKNKSFLANQSDVLGPFNVQVPVEMQAEFDGMQQQYYTKTGNLEVSQRAAWDNVAQVWGVTEVGMGGKRWMKYAPEKLAPNGGSDWIEKQLLQDVQAVRPDREFKAKELSLQYDDETRNAVGRGEVPTYQIWTVEDGLMKPLMSPEGQMLRFQPDYNVSETRLQAVKDHTDMVQRDTEMLRLNRLQNLQREKQGIPFKGEFYKGR